MSRRERRNSKSSLCHKEDLPSAWIRYQLSELWGDLCTCQWMSVALMLFQTDVKGAHGHTPSKGSKVASLRTFQYLHTFNPSGSVMDWRVKPFTLRTMLLRMWSSWRHNYIRLARYFPAFNSSMPTLFCHGRPIFLRLPSRIVTHLWDGTEKRPRMDRETANL